jgi:hypothetical protein
MASMNATMKLKTQGIDAKQDAQVKVNVFDIVIPREGTMKHPRANDSVDEALLTNDQGTGIMDKGEVEDPILVWRKGIVDGKLLMELIAGSRRTNGLIEAVRRWKEAGTFREGMQYIKVKFYVGDEKGAWKARLLENSDPTKKADSIRVLAISACQMKKLAMTDDEILAVMPRHVRTKADLDALYRYEDLTPEAATTFDAGAPLALLPTVLDAPRDKQAETAAKLVEAGATTSNKAARVVNREARANGQKAERPLTPKQIRALAVGAGKIGVDNDLMGKFYDEHGTVDVDPIIAAAQADGFALLGRLLTQEIKIDDLPMHLRTVAREVLNKK